MQYFTLAVVEQVSAVCSALSSSRAALVALLGCLWLLSLLIAVDRPQNSVSALLRSELLPLSLVLFTQRLLAVGPFSPACPYDKG